MLRRSAALIVVAALSACTADHKWASDADVAAARYVAGPPYQVTLVTSLNSRSGEGAHSALIINGSQKVLYDPAGSWELDPPLAPERNDLHYGMTPAFEASYLRFQGNGVFHVETQTLEVSKETADGLIASAITQGAANKAFCANSVTKVLARVPQFAHLGKTMFPKALSREFGLLPGVQAQDIHYATATADAPDAPAAVGN